MAEFWSSWDKKLADKELNGPCETVAKRTAVMAQRASLTVSANGFSAIHADVSTTPTIGMIEDQYVEDDFPQDPEDDDSDGGGEREYLESSPEVQIVVPTGANASPFHDLIAYVFQKVKNKSASLPSFAPGGPSTNQEELYNATLLKLKESGPVEAKKDVLQANFLLSKRVLLSGIINTLSPDARRFRLSKKIMMGFPLSSVGPESQIHTAAKDVLATLLKALYSNLDKDQYSEPDFVNLQQKMWQLLSETASSKKTQEAKARYITLQVVQQIVLWIELKVFVPPTSEHVFVSAWTTLLNILLHDTSMRAIPGELASKASARARQAAEQAYGSTTSTPCGRKIDISTRIQVRNEWKQEIAIFEFKSSQATKQMLQRQQNKSVRLNAAIMMDLETHGLNIEHSYPIIAEGQGLSEHLRRYAIDIQDVLAKTPSSPFEGGDDDDLAFSPALPSTPPPKKRSDSFILFSPSKKDKHNDCDHDDGAD
ncbi:hypothetical protein KI688_003662 [Linnemannia hyalina]|uniref:Uncharacterized protein n=1 Tax=Linnemannia hyalina TaxID=64524 RepID=A0A9P7XP38_9FUNG|nr:hypothetical protein KI688_003662 [Linnemannia hyalina]